LPTSAQDAPPVFSYATYFERGPSREARADALLRENFFPIFGKHVSAKRLNGLDGWPPTWAVTGDAWGS
jgi:hypothetical protein